MIIYKLENKINGKIYIGQTKKNLSQRIATHIKINKYYVQKALNKYGLESFIISVIDEAAERSILDEKEKYWIKHFDCRAPKGYNCTDGGDGVKGYVPTDEARERSRQIRLGKKHSEETKTKISEGNRGKVLSFKTREKIKESWVIRKQRKAACR